jgi:ATP-dependent RNA helicase SrmB
MGFSSVVNQIAEEAKWRKQNMLFSATLEGPGIEKFANTLLNEPVRLDAVSSRKEQGKILQWLHLADDANHKYKLLKHILLHQVTTAVVFIKTRDRLNQLKQRLDSDDIKVIYLQGEMPQDKRNDAMAKFKSGEVNILLATDVAARGIDVDDISHVINYDLPRTADIYVHRIGRTGRAGKKGTAISIAEAHDMRIIQKIERYIEQGLKRRVIEELRPKNREARAPVKKKKPKLKTAKAKKRLKKKQSKK